MSPNSSQPQHGPADQPAGNGGAALSSQRQLVLIKSSQRFVFRYQKGEEAQVLECLIEQAKDPDSVMDWFDAAVLSHQLGQTLGRQLEQILKD